MLIQPYLFFGGSCEQALEFYREKLGAEVEMMMRFSDSPESCDSGQMPADWGDKIMHASFRIGDSVVMASDGCGTSQMKFDGFSLSIIAANEAESQRVFEALSDGGQVNMPLSKTFFSPSFGMVADRFGVCWMVYVDQK